MMGGMDSHLGSRKVCVLYCTLFLIRPTYSKLWIWRLWCKEVGRVRIHAFLEQQHQACWRMGNDRGPPKLCLVTSPGGFWGVILELLPRLPMCLLALKPLFPSSLWPTWTRVISWHQFLITHRFTHSTLWPVYSQIPSSGYLDLTSTSIQPVTAMSVNTCDDLLHLDDSFHLWRSGLETLPILPTRMSNGNNNS